MSDTNPGLLLVEDNQADVMFFKRALTRTKAPIPLRVAVNGMEAVEALSGTGPLPSLVVLDLKLPRMSGLEVLEWMRSHPTLSSLRVGILTSSAEERDILRAHTLGTAFYVVKPVDFAVLQNVVSAIAAYWADPNGPALVTLAQLAAPLPARP